MAKKEELDNIAGNEKLRALQAAMDKIEKSFGKGSIMKLGDDSFEDVDVIQVGARNMQNLECRTWRRWFPTWPYN